MNINELYNAMRSDVQAAFDNSKEWRTFDKFVKNFIPYTDNNNSVVWLHDGKTIMWNNGKTPNEAFSELLQAAQNLDKDNPLKLNSIDEIVYIWIPSLSQLKINKDKAKDLAPVYLVTKHKDSKADNDTLLVWFLNEQPRDDYNVGIYKWGACFERTRDTNWLIIHLLRALKIDF